MKSKLDGRSLVIGVVLAAAVALCAAAATSGQPEKWEYRVLISAASHGANIEADLNRLGREGWRVASLASFEQEHATARSSIILMRPLD